MAVAALGRHAQDPHRVDQQRLEVDVVPDLSALPQVREPDVCVKEPPDQV